MFIFQLKFFENNIVYKFQSGFRQNYSTDTALSYLSNKIQRGLDEGLYTDSDLIDLQKAFDTFDPIIFLEKLKCIGFNKNTLAWYRAYLHRYFKVNAEDSYSVQAILVCGVPHGSILGPLFFIYANNMSQAVDCDRYLYANDSCLVYRGKEIKDI